LVCKKNILLPHEAALNPLKQERLICVGKLLRPHGVQGKIKVQSLTVHGPEFFQWSFFFLDNGQSLVLEHATPMGSHVFLVNIKGFSTRESLEPLKGQKLFVPRSLLKEIDTEDEFYYEDLKELQVYNTQGKNVGIVTGVFDFGSGDVLEIALTPPQEHIFLKPSLDSQDVSKPLKDPLKTRQNHRDCNTPLSQNPLETGKVSLKNSDKKKRSASKTFFVPFSSSLIPKILLSQGYLVISDQGLEYLKDDL
jgi:16S rRNA processing protein RimM